MKFIDQVMDEEKRIRDMYSKLTRIYFTVYDFHKYQNILSEEEIQKVVIKEVLKTKKELLSEFRKTELDFDKLTF